MTSYYIIVYDRSLSQIEYIEKGEGEESEIYISYLEAKKVLTKYLKDTIADYKRCLDRLIAQTEHELIQETRERYEQETEPGT